MELTNSNLQNAKSIIKKSETDFLIMPFYMHVLLRMPFTSVTKAVSSAAAISRHMKGLP